MDIHMLSNRLSDYMRFYITVKFTMQIENKRGPEFLDFVKVCLR